MSDFDWLQSLGFKTPASRLSSGTGPVESRDSKHLFCDWLLTLDVLVLRRDRIEGIAECCPPVTTRRMSRGVGSSRLSG